MSSLSCVDPRFRWIGDCREHAMLSSEVRAIVSRPLGVRPTHFVTFTCAGVVSSLCLQSQLHTNEKTCVNLSFTYNKNLI